MGLINGKEDKETAPLCAPVNIEKRKYPKFPIDLRAKYRGPNDASKQTGRVQNVSGSELSLHLDRNETDFDVENIHRFRHLEVH